MRRRMTIALGPALAVVAAAASRTAHAGGVVEELAAGGAPRSAQSPGSRWVSDKLAGIWDIDESWQLRLDLSSTRVLSQAADSAAGDVFLSAVSAVYSADEHWSLRLNGGWSPVAAQLAAVQVDTRGLFTAPDAPMTAGALLHAATTSYAYGAGLDYDSASDDVHSLSWSLSMGVTHYTARQEIVSVDEPAGGALDAAAVRMRCPQDGPCSGELSPQTIHLGQFALTGSIADTVDHDTDLSLDASLYLYDKDPMRLGYNALATISTSTLGSASGAALLRDSITPSIAHRWGDLSATASVSLSDYIDGREADVGASLRIQYRLALAGARRLKLNAKLAAGSHIDQDFQLTRSGSAALGAQYTW
jgi:hypothetical protein